MISRYYRAAQELFYKKECVTIEAKENKLIICVSDILYYEFIPTDFDTFFGFQVNACSAVFLSMAEKLAFVSTSFSEEFKPILAEHVTFLNEIGKVLYHEFTIKTDRKAIMLQNFESKTTEILKLFHNMVKTEIRGGANISLFSTCLSALQLTEFMIKRLHSIFCRRFSNVVICKPLIFNVLTLLFDDAFDQKFTEIIHMKNIHVELNKQEIRIIFPGETKVEIPYENLVHDVSTILPDICFGLVDHTLKTLRKIKHILIVLDLKEKIKIIKEVHKFYNKVYTKTLYSNPQQILEQVEESKNASDLLCNFVKGIENEIDGFRPALTSDSERLIAQNMRIIILNTLHGLSMNVYESVSDIHRFLIGCVKYNDKISSLTAVIHM